MPETGTRCRLDVSARLYHDFRYSALSFLIFARRSILSF